MRRLVLAVTLVWFASAAFAGQACTEKTLSPADVRAALTLALDVRDALDREHAEIALVARVGRDMSRYGMRYSHVAFAWRGHPRGDWTMVEELNQCGTASSALYDDGLANFFLDDMFAYEAKVVIPSPSVQRRIATVLVAGHGGRFHEPHYNLVAYPFATRYQNSNQWLLETLVEALAERPIGNRTEAQAWLRSAGFRPSTLYVPPMERLGAQLFRANVAFDDQPIERRMAGKIDVVSAESVLDFVQRVDPAAVARLIAVDQHR
ncbi:MAG: DUF2145 domain-containing protein [Betaproteobacteria bacterium]